MTTKSQVSEALALFSTFETVRDAVVVQTHCMYPDNALVAVYVRGGPNSGFQVSDEGRAIDELTVSNKLIPNVKRFLTPICEMGGLKVADDGRIVSRRVGLDNLVSAVLFVANASAEAVRKGLSVLKHHHSHEPTSLRDDLYRILYRHFSERHVHRDVRIQGATNRFYRFDAAIMLGGGRRLLLDPVTPDANSINSRYVAHTDIGHSEDVRFVQRIVYDDREQWQAPDLNLLRRAATIVPYSQCETAVKRLLENHHGFVGHA